MLKVDDVTQVYSGRPGCMCGCNGKYRAASQYRSLVEKERGYAMSDDDVSDRSVKVMLGKVLRADYKVDLFRSGDGCIYNETDTRSQVVYFRKGTKLFDDVDCATLTEEA